MIFMLCEQNIPTKPTDHFIHTEAFHYRRQIFISFHLPKSCHPFLLCPESESVHPQGRKNARNKIGHLKLCSAILSPQDFAKALGIGTGEEQGDIITPLPRPRNATKTLLQYTIFCITKESVNILWLGKVTSSDGTQDVGMDMGL